MSSAGAAPNGHTRCGATGAFADSMAPGGMMADERNEEAAAVPEVVQTAREQPGGALLPSRLFVSFTAVDSGSFSRTAGEN